MSAASAPPRGPRALLWRLAKDRARKHGLYDAASYWDERVLAYAGLARSIWPSNTYNRHWDERQMRIVDRALGDVRGLRIADVGCGTGRASLHLARRGAAVAGLDFSERAVEAAREAARREGLGVDFRVRDVAAPPDDDLVGRFDAALTIGCLAMACAEPGAFDRALGNVVSLVRPAGRVLFLEPIHRRFPLRRILGASVAEWVAACARRGLRLLASGGMGFVPVRVPCALVELPDAVVGPAFRAGEALLDASARLRVLADYTWLLFTRADVPAAAEPAADRPPTSGHA